MDFEAFLNAAWSEHASEPEAVAQRLTQSTAMLQETAQIPPYAQLGAHVFGEHLGQWRRGITFLETLTEVPCFTAGTEADATIRRLVAALELANGTPSTERSRLQLSDHVRVLSLAAAALTGQAQTKRATELFSQALELASGIADDDPAQRALAVVSNNLAADLEEKAERTAGERELMLLAARTARARWRSQALG